MSGRSAAAPKLLAGGAAGPETIDKVWCIDKEVPEGPFRNLDRLGLNTPATFYAASGGPRLQAAARYVKEHHIDQGKLGQPTGEGFFKTPAD
jgi:3-hydroxybutyryl-CoA dehydrogenase